MDRIHWAGGELSHLRNLARSGHVFTMSVAAHRKPTAAARMSERSTDDVVKQHRDPRSDA